MKLFPFPYKTDWLMYFVIEDENWLNFFICDELVGVPQKLNEKQEENFLLHEMRANMQR